MKAKIAHKRKRGLNTMEKMSMDLAAWKAMDLIAAAPEEYDMDSAECVELANRAETSREATLDAIYTAFKYGLMMGYQATKDGVIRGGKA